jgi:hypothetical protein
MFLEEEEEEEQEEDSSSSSISSSSNGVWLKETRINCAIYSCQYTTYMKPLQVISGKKNRK